MKITKYIIGIVIASLLFFASCQEDDGFKDFNAGGTNTKAFAGEWFVRSYDADGVATSDYHKITTFNTALDNDSIWIADDGFINFKIKTLTNTSDLSFSSENEKNIEVDEETITLTEGKILEDQGKSIKTKTIIDSIALKIVKSTSPDEIILIGGHRRTGFVEDKIK